MMLPNNDEQGEHAKPGRPGRNPGMTPGRGGTEAILLIGTEHEDSLSDRLRSAGSKPYGGSERQIASRKDVTGSGDQADQAPFSQQSASPSFLKTLET